MNWVSSFYLYIWFSFVGIILESYFCLVCTFLLKLGFLDEIFKLRNLIIIDLYSGTLNQENACNLTLCLFRFYIPFPRFFCSHLVKTQLSSHLSFYSKSKHYDHILQYKIVNSLTSELISNLDTSISDKKSTRRAFVFHRTWKTIFLVY